MYINGHYYPDEFINEANVKNSKNNAKKILKTGVYLTAFIPMLIAAGIKANIDIKKYEKKRKKYNFEDFYLDFSGISFYSLTEALEAGYESKSNVEKEIKSIKNKKYIETNNIENFAIYGFKSENDLKKYLDKHRGSFNKTIKNLGKPEWGDSDAKKIYDKFEDKDVSVVSDIYECMHIIYCHNDQNYYYINYYDNPAIIKTLPMAKIIQKSNSQYSKLQKLLNDHSIKESYIQERKEIKMNKIDNLARIARQYGITESGNLRDDIVSEYTDIIESLNTIDESIIVKDISLLPVYKINESTKAKDNMPKKCTKCGSTNIGVFLKGEPIYQCKECGEYLGTVPFKEGYAIDLDSLKYVVESKEISLEEAIQEIKDVNYIGDTYQMYCVLPENINENMSLESFNILNESLSKANIIPIAITELSRKDWKDIGKEYKYEDRYRFKQTFENMTDIIKNLFTNPQKDGNFEAIRPRLLRMVDRCKTLEDVNYLKRDLRAGKVQLTKLKADKPEIADGIDKHIKWLETVYMDALNNKAKELKGKK